MVEADPHTELKLKIACHAEWLLVRDESASFALRSTEIEVDAANGRLRLGFLDDRGFHKLRLNGFEIGSSEIALDVSGAFGGGREKLRLVPRESAGALAAALEAARLEQANELARGFADGLGVKLVRVGITRENSRFAQILFRERSGRIVAVLNDLTDTVTEEGLLTTAVLTLAKLRSRKKDPVTEVWIASGKRRTRKLRKLHALLRPSFRSAIKVAEIPDAASGFEGVRLHTPRRIGDLWREKCPKLRLPASFEMSATARRIVELSPANIDVVYSRQGETLRFLGLPFARVRRIANREKAWFGIEKARNILTESTWPLLLSLVEELRTYRSPQTPNKRHQLYGAAPEAWLESILRRNIALLDANLILSPIYNQYRASNDKIDLLALRRDGRLVIIELKTKPDREMIYQAADYWRKIELQRRSGELRGARAFGEMEILDRPALVYFAAPALSFHRDLQTFASTLSPEIEMWRFELHRNWRANLKVISRGNYTGE